jgi:Tol biopolymer transport system component
MKQAFILMLIIIYVKVMGQKVEIKLFQQTGLDCSWDPSGSDKIAYSKKGGDKFYDIHISLPDGTNDTCITCNHPNLPNKHISNMAWHPSGKWLLAVVEKSVHKGSSTDALPGFGAYCDIYLVSNDGTKTFKIIDEPNDYDHGIIAPKFSGNGKKIVWTERKRRPNFFSLKRTFGYWVIKTADFSFDKDNIPVVKNIKIIEPGGDGFYECYGFSPDGAKLIFCSSMNEKSVWDQQIYVIDTTGNNLKKLTSGGYNEHGVFAPNGERIVWMTNIDNKNKGTDWWMMNADGTNKKRLTFFNDKKSPQYEGHARWAGLVSFNADGKKFVGGVQLNLITQEGKIVIVELKE